MEERERHEQRTGLSPRERDIVEIVLWVFSPALLALAATFVALILGAPLFRSGLVFSLVTGAVGAGLIFVRVSWLPIGRVRAGGLVYAGFGALWLTLWALTPRSPEALAQAAPPPAAAGAVRATDAVAADGAADQEAKVQPPAPVERAEPTPERTRESSTGAVVGRWCDSWSPTLKNEMIIVRRDDGGLELRSHFTTGSRLTQELRLVDGTYLTEGSTSGDRYRIGADRELRLYDNDGFIRTAPPTSGGQCLRSRG